MNIGILGTGVVGEAIGTALIERGHAVKMGSRTADNERAAAWVKKAGRYASQGTFTDAAHFGDLLFLCLNGSYALTAVQTISTDAINDKIILDLTNPLDFSKGMPPGILQQYSNGTSLGEQIQQALPNAYIIKTLNTVNYNLMVDARKVDNGNHNLFVCGNDTDAKNKAMHFLVDNFYWKPEYIIDLGGIEAARCVEAIVPFWVLVYRSIGTPLFNFKIVH